VKKESALTDGMVEVKFKPISGKEDQAAGLVWRWKDGDNSRTITFEGPGRSECGPRPTASPCLTISPSPGAPASKVAPGELELAFLGCIVGQSSQEDAR